MNIDFDKQEGMVPAIIQDEATGQVLMLGYMNREALEKTMTEGIVTFYSRSKNRLWTKGESSGNYLRVQRIETDCDADTLLICATPAGPVCHTGSHSCFGGQQAKGFLYELQNIIRQRIEEKDAKSYTQKLYQKGINKVAQKVGEEAVELIIEAKDTDDERFVNEAADLMYHFMVLLHLKKIDLSQVETTLLQRHQKS